MVHSKLYGRLTSKRGRLVMTSSQQHVTSKPPPQKRNRNISLIAMISVVAGIVSPFLMSTMMTAEGGGAAAEEALEGGAAAEEAFHRMFTISGKKHGEDFFRRFVERLGLQNEVRLPAGRIHPDDIQDFFQTLLTNVRGRRNRIQFMNTWMQTAADLNINVVDRSQLSVYESMAEMHDDLRKETLQISGYSMDDDLRPPPRPPKGRYLDDDDELRPGQVPPRYWGASSHLPPEPHAEWKRIISEEDKYMCCVGRHPYQVALQRLQRKTYERNGILHILHHFRINLTHDSDEVKALLSSPNEILPEEILANQESLQTLYEFIDALNSPYVVRSRVLSYLQDAAASTTSLGGGAASPLLQSNASTSLGGGAASPLLQSNASSNASSPLAASPLLQSNASSPLAGSPLPLSKFACTGCSVM